MNPTTTAAFISALPLSATSFTLRRARPAHDARIPLTRAPFPRTSPACGARSLDSYRDGERFAPSGRPAARKPRKSKKPSAAAAAAAAARPKARMALAAALCEMRVASMETCAFLARSGCVRVNGRVERDAKARVHRVEDCLSVDGREFGSVESWAKGEGGGEGKGEEAVVLPRGQRDFPNSARLEQLGVTRRYHRKVDRGFYEGKRYASGK